MEQAPGSGCIVRELGEGETLDHRLKRGPIPVEEALELAKQVADALEAAHAKNIQHRDLKPANMQITPDGHVKVLDFGLAKVLSRDAAPSDLSNSPTISVAQTAAGVILGTAPYMSPEQVRGHVVDNGTDIWAFGCVLFEMLTGRKAVEGPTVSDVIASIMKSEPDWTLLPLDVPATVRSLIRQCLRKQRKNRLHNIA